MTKSELARSVLPSHTYSESQRRIDEEQAAKVITDNNVDHKRYKVYIDSIKRETEKAIDWPASATGAPADKRKDGCRSRRLSLSVTARR